VICSAVHVAIDTVGTGAVTGPVASHVGRCAACDRDVTELRLVEEALESLDPVAYAAPGHLQISVMGSLGPVAVPDAERRASLAVPVAAAAVVATAAAGTAAVIMLRRQSAA
jgi:hypothetical protein